MSLNIKDLITMYYIHSPSGNESGLAGFIKMKLHEMGIPFKTDKYGQIYSFKKGCPLVSAHMDQVFFKPVSKVVWQGDKISADSNIGADDKNGVFICLKLLEKYHDKLSFVFSTEEERGGNIGTLLERVSNLSTIPYALVFDRRNGSDIIGDDNDYCSPEFRKHVEKISVPRGYKFTQGTFSDCDALSNYMNSVNISCGYYGAHTEKEYTLLSDLFRGFELGCSIIENLSKRITKKPVKKQYGKTAWFKDSKNWIESSVCEVCGKTIMYTPAIFEETSMCDSCFSYYKTDLEEGIF